VTLRPKISILAVNTALHRVVLTSRAAAGALFFGPRSGHQPTGRFDSPSGAFRVCYLAASPRGAFAESILRVATPPDAVSGLRIVAERDLALRSWARTVTTRDLRLADLRGGRGLAPLGATGAITMADSHVAARALSETLHAADVLLDGIRFRVRHDPDETAVAIFDRAADALAAVTELVPMLADAGTLGQLLDAYQLALDL
jgi:RES domain